MLWLYASSAYDDPALFLKVLEALYNKLGELDMQVSRANWTYRWGGSCWASWTSRMEVGGSSWGNGNGGWASWACR